MSMSDIENLEAGVLIAKQFFESSGVTDVYRTRPFAAHPGGEL